MSTPKALTLCIELLHIQPVVFRRLVVPGDITLPALYQVIQAAFGWDDDHLHEFIFGKDHYAPPGPASEMGFDEPLSTTGVCLSNALIGSKPFRYVYDFGDDWQHLVTVEESASSDTTMTPLCIDGANACPPEDVGGPPGFMNFVEAMSDPKHEEHADMMRWHGERFDPKRFNRSVVNRRLKKIS
jgi:Plasmid pRiA4b ORF-3-like protein